MLSAALDLPSYDPSALANEAEQKLSDIIKQVTVLHAPCLVLKCIQNLDLTAIVA